MLPTHGTSRRPAEATLCVILVLLLGLPLLLGLLLLSPCNFIYLLIIEYLFSIYLPLFAHAACWQANAHPAPLPSYPAASAPPLSPDVFIKADRKIDEARAEPDQHHTVTVMCVLVGDSMCVCMERGTRGVSVWARVCGCLCVCKYFVPLAVF